MSSCCRTERALALVGAVTMGFSQVFFGLILDNPEHFPRLAGFHAWTLFWVGFLPLGLAAGIDLLLEKTGGLRAWRALLFAAALVSFLRQIQVAYPSFFAGWLGRTPPWLLAPALLALFAALAWRRPDGARRYLAALGVLGLWLGGTYVAKTGLWGPAWASERPPEVRGRTSPPVFVLIFDELSYEVLHDGDRVRPEYPAFARLAGEAAAFTRATTNHFWTERAIPTMLTGRLRPEPGRPTCLDLLAAERDVLLFDHALIAERWVSRGRVVSRGKARYLALSPGAALAYLWAAAEEGPFARSSLGDERAAKLPPPAAWGAASGHAWVRREVDLLLGAVGESRGRVTYWHGAVPHAPFVFDRHGVPHGRAADKFYPGLAGIPANDPAEVLANYREQVGYADTILGRFLERLREEGLHEEAVVVVTSDHGLRTWYGDLQPAGWPEVQNGLTPRVPLFIKAPGLAPGPRDVDYQHVDFAPTLLSLLGVAHDPAAFEGRSALEPGAPRRKIFLTKEDAYVLDERSGLWTRAPRGAAPGF